MAKRRRTNFGSSSVGSWLLWIGGGIAAVVVVGLAMVARAKASTRSAAIAPTVPSQSPYLRKDVGFNQVWQLPPIPGQAMATACFSTPDGITSSCVVHQAGQGIAAANVPPGMGPNTRHTNEVLVVQAAALGFKPDPLQPGWIRA